MTVKEYSNLIGKEASINLNGLTILVELKDVKQTYGRTRFLITPVSGSGEIWIESVSIDGKAI